LKIGINALFLIPGEVGGTETYLREVLLAMAQSFVDVEWVLFTNRENDGSLKRIFKQFPKFAFHLLSLKATNRYARIIREQVDLPFRAALCHVDLLWSPGYTAPFFSPCPQVVTIHDMQYKRHPEDLTFIARIATDLLVRSAVRRCQKIIAVSEFSRSEIIQFTRVSSGKIVVIPEAADPLYAEMLSKEEIRKRLAPLFPSDRSYILCVANSYPHKNVHSLIQAFGDILDRVPNDLVLVGKPRLGEPLVQKAITRLPSKDRFHRIDRVDKGQLIALYQGADLFVFPSLYEGFGLPVLEAMLAGTPVIATRKGAIPEVGGDHITYFDADRSGDLSHQMMRLLNLPSDQRRILIRIARTHAESFSWKLTAGRSIACFQDLI
jgi:glycosyltransferase involved in cell wall biosynthesis